MSKYDFIRSSPPYPDQEELSISGYLGSEIRRRGPSYSSAQVVYAGTASADVTVQPTGEWIGNYSVRLEPPTRVAKPSPRREKVLRRLRGFLVQVEGEDARVAFVHDGETQEYILPFDRLKRGGITADNQPFEMDEVEIESEKGPVIGQRFRPMAKSSESFVDTIELDEKRKSLRSMIFGRFKNAED